MGKRYFTVSQKERVRNRLIARSFDPRRDSLDREEKQLAQGLYEQLFSAEDRARMDALPDGWLPIAGSLHVDPGPSESNIKLEFDGTRRHPARWSTIVKWGDLPEVAQALVQEHNQADKLLKSERDKTSREVQALLDGFRTVEQAQEAWPEAANIIGEVVGAPRIRTLPAVTTLNAALDLPPEEGEKAA